MLDKQSGNETKASSEIVAATSKYKCISAHDLDDSYMYCGSQDLDHSFVKDVQNSYTHNTISNIFS